MADFLPAAIGAVVSDVLSVCGVPGASTVGVAFSAAVKGVMARRRDNARDILLEELRKGAAFVDQAASIDEWVAVLLRYSRAAQEGTARLNLRLMAKVIAGQAQAGPLVADEFLAWADVLASLRREEVILIACLAKEQGAWDGTGAKGSRWVITWGRVQSALVPSIFENEGAMGATATAASRTGLIVPDEGGAYLGSPQLEKLQTLVAFQDALREEGFTTEGGRGFQMPSPRACS